MNVILYIDSIQEALEALFNCQRYLIRSRIVCPAQRGRKYNIGDSDRRTR